MGGGRLLRSSTITVRMPLNPQLSAGEVEELFAEAEVVTAEARAASGEGSVEYRDARAISERWRRALQRCVRVRARSRASACVRAAAH